MLVIAKLQKPYCFKEIKRFRGRFLKSAEKNEVNIDCL